MTARPEDIAREQIDRMLVSAGWAVQDAKAVNFYAKQGVAIREFELKSGFGTADYLLYVDGKAAGVIEAKKAGSTLTGVEIQSAKYSKGCRTDFLHGRVRFPSVINQQVSKPDSQTASIPNLAPARYSSFISPKPLLTGYPMVRRGQRCSQPCRRSSSTANTDAQLSHPPYAAFDQRRPLARADIRYQEPRKPSARPQIKVPACAGTLLYPNRTATGHLQDTLLFGVRYQK